MRLLRRVEALIEIENDGGGDTVLELDALRSWALARTPHLLVTTIELADAQWEQWCQTWAVSEARRPDPVSAPREVLIIDDWQRELGEGVLAR